MTNQTVAVGLGELHSSKDSTTVLVCYGLGSCIGIAAFDPVTRVGAMAHVVLPDSSMARGSDGRGKFADSAIPALLEEIQALGGSKSGLVVKIAGGAQVLAILGSRSKLDIGARNIEAVRAALDKARIPLAAEDTGGNYGRTMQLVMGSGRVVVSTIGRGEKEL